MFAKKFKSAIVLKLDSETVDFSDIEGILNSGETNYEFHTAEGTQSHTIGLLKIDEVFVKDFSGLQVINVGQSVKKVNKKKVKKLLEQKLAEMEQDFIAENPDKEFFVNKEDKKVIEADIIFSLLPETDPEDFNNYVVLDKQEGFVYVLNSTKKNSETVTSFIRAVIEGFPVVPVVDNSEKMVKGFKDLVVEMCTTDTRLALGNYIKLEDEEGVVTWTKESLYDSKASELIETGKDVVALGLEYDGLVSFVVDQEMKLSAIKFPKYFNEDGSFESNVLLCFNEIRGVVEDVLKETLNK